MTNQERQADEGYSLPADQGDVRVNTYLPYAGLRLATVKAPPHSWRESLVFLG